MWSSRRGSRPILGGDHTRGRIERLRGAQELQRNRLSDLQRELLAKVALDNVLATAVTVFPEQKFREGFNVAGDDILLRVVQGHVLPPIESALRAAGIANPGDLLAELVGGDRGGEDVIQRNLRQQFALQIAQPIALEFLRAAETFDPTSGVVAAEPRPYESFFPGGAKPSPHPSLCRDRERRRAERTRSYAARARHLCRLRPAQERQSAWPPRQGRPVGPLRSASDFRLW